MLDHAALGDLPIPAHGRGPLGTHPLVAVGVHVELAAQLVDGTSVFARPRPDAARQHVHDGMLDGVVADVGKAPVQRVQVVEDRAGRAKGPPLDAEAVGPVVLERALGRHLVDRTGNVVANAADALVILGEPVHERLVAAVVAGNTLGAHDEHVLEVLSRHG